MIAFAVGVRLLIYFVPGVLPYNFTPVEAIALFGGAYFSTARRLAFIVPLGAMLLSDAIIAASLSAQYFAFWYQSAPAVYASIALTVLGGFALRHRVGAVRVAGYGFASAVLFFLVTNFAAWLFSASGQGASICREGLIALLMSAARPFFNGTLAGTLFWSAILFGGFEVSASEMRFGRSCGPHCAKDA